MSDVGFIPRITYRLGAGACVATIARVSTHCCVREDKYKGARGADRVDTICLHGDVKACWRTVAGTDGLLSRD